MAEKKPSPPKKEKKPVKKSATKKAVATKKAAPKKPTAKKPAAKKATTKKTVAVKATHKKAAAKKAAPKKTTTRKATPKKAAPKKATAKKAAPKKAAPGKKPAATRNQPQKKAAPPAPEDNSSDYYVIRTIQKITDKYSDTMADYNQNIKRAMETGMEFVEDVGKGTVEAIGTFVGDGKELVTRVPGMDKMVSKMEDSGEMPKSVAGKMKKAVMTPAKKAEFMVTTVLLKAAEETASTVRQYNEKYFKKTMEYGSDFMADVGNLASMAMGELGETGKKFVANLAILETMEASMQNKKGAFSTPISLPNKQDVKKLTDAMEAFNNKMKDLLGSK